MKYQIRAKLTVINPETKFIIQAGQVYQYTNELREEFLGLSTKRLHAGIQTPAQFTNKVLEKYDHQLSLLVSLHHVPFFSFSEPWIVEHKLIDFTILES